MAPHGHCIRFTSCLIFDEEWCEMNVIHDYNSSTYPHVLGHGFFRLILQNLYFMDFIKRSDKIFVPKSHGWT